MDSSRPFWFLVDSPPFANASDRRKARLLLLASRTVLLSILIFDGIRLYMGQYLGAAIQSVGIVGAAISLYLLQKRRLLAATYTLLIPLTLISIVLALIFEGVHDISLLAMSAILACSAFLLNSRQYLYLAAAGIAAILGVMVLEIYGFVRPGVSSSLSPLDALDIAALTAMTVLAVYWLSERMSTDIRVVEKQAELLARSEKRYRSLVESVSQAYTEADQRGTIIYCNPGFLALTGRSEEDLLGSNGIDLINESDRPSVIEAFTASIREKADSVTVEFKIQDRSGRVFWVEQTSHLEYDAMGEYLKCMNTLKNVDQRKKVEERLRQSELTYRGILDSLGEAVYVQDSSGTFLDVNEGAVRMYGYSREELIGMQPIAIAAEGMNDFDSVAVQIAQAYDGRPQRLLFWGKRKDGHGFPKEIHLYPGSYFGQKVVIAVARDITERVDEESTRRVLEKQLHEAQKLESVGTLAAGIAHDFNNILSIIICNAALVEEDPSDVQHTMQRMKVILTASDRAAGVVKQILAFARKADADMQETDVNMAVADLLVLLKDTLPRNIQISENCQPSLPSVLADPNQLRQVLLNLALNARDAMPAGGMLTIETRLVGREDAKGSIPDSVPGQEFVEVAVEDTGQGIAEANRGRVFEPFFTTKGIGEGTGLGLAVAYGIVQRHQGHIAFTSEEHRGTSFQVLLPLKSQRSSSNGA